MPLKSSKKKSSKKKSSKKKSSKKKSSKGGNEYKKKRANVKSNPINEKEKKNNNILPKLSSLPTNKYAYVWLLMKGDSYTPGIFTSAYSVLRTKPNADLVVMVTDDVSKKSRKNLLKIVTHLYDINYLTYDMAPMYTKKQENIYRNWKSVMATKWQSLALPYKKILFIDGDTIVTKNLDHLFDCKAPGAPFNHSFVKPLGYINSYTNGKKDTIGYLDHGEIIKPMEIKNMLKKEGMLLTANTVLLEPNINDYKKYKKMVEKKQPYGVKNKCFSAPDEQSIAEYYALEKKMPWTNFHQRYNYIGWKKGFLPKNMIPLNIHYFNEEKPWKMKWNKWPDVISWYKMANEAIKYAKIKPKDILLDKNNIINADKADDIYIKDFTNNKKINTVLDIMYI